MTVLFKALVFKDHRKVSNLKASYPNLFIIFCYYIHLQYYGNEDDAVNNHLKDHLRKEGHIFCLVDLRWSSHVPMGFDASVSPSYETS